MATRRPFLDPRGQPVSYQSQFATQATSNSTTTEKPVVSPLSTDPPTELDLEYTKVLVTFLHDKGLIEPREESEHRERVLASLNALLQRACKKFCAMKKFPPEQSEKINLRIFTFGSFCLGVHTSGGDIDTLYVGPRVITRKDFFTFFANEISSCELVKDFAAVPDAYVPILTFNYDGIDIDLLYAPLDVPYIPEKFDIKDDKYLIGCDPETIRSLNGCRVASKILSLVPNIENYRTTLRFFKMWANVRGVYSNVMGYPGGVAWAILVAFICQLYPTAEPVKLIERFFRVYSAWKWPASVNITHRVVNPAIGERVWDPMYSSDLMPVITPAYPCMNSTYNISRPTKRVILSEFQRGLQLTKPLEKCGLPPEEVMEILKKLSEPTDFFLRYNNYLDIVITAGTNAELDRWFGWVESKVRLLVKSIDALNDNENDPPIKLHPHPISFKEPAPATEGEEEAKSDAEKRPPPRHFYIGIDTRTLEAQIKANSDQPRALNIGDQIEEWINMLYTKMTDRSPTMEVTVNSVRAYDLPEFVFPDERRPEKKKKKKKDKQKTEGDEAKQEQGSVQEQVESREGPITQDSKRVKLDESGEATNDPTTSEPTPQTPSAQQEKCSPSSIQDQASLPELGEKRKEPVNSV